MVSVRTSATQLNEGESLLSTVDTNFSAGTTLYYRVVGKGINKKDFRSGALKGKIVTKSGGSASISHILQNDKATEGKESFKVQFYSDKKLKRLIGESNIVNVIDTSRKAVKKPTATTSASNSSQGNSLSGRYMEIDGIKLESGKTYTHDSVTGQQLLKMGQNALATTQDYRGQYDQYYIENNGSGYKDERLAGPPDPVTGYRPLTSLPNGASYRWKYEFDEKYAVFTAQYINGEVKTTSRVGIVGKLTYDNNRLASITASETADTYVNGWALINAYSGGSRRQITSETKFAPFIFDTFGETFGKSTSIADYPLANSSSDMKGLFGFGNGKMFSPGWDKDPFSVNVL